MPPVPEPVATPPAAWLIFIALVLGVLVLDLLLFNRKAHVQGIREAALWSGVWVGLAAAFNVGIYFWKDEASAVEFTTAYLVEQALSVDNLFIFMIIFRYFAVPTVLQHRVLFWGVLGAQVMRGIMIFAGVELLAHFHWLIFVFGAILVLTGLKLLIQKDETYEPSKTWAFRLTRRYVPLTERFHEDHFFTRVPVDGQPSSATAAATGGPVRLRRVATPLFLVLVIVESTDLIFAVDSIPACLGISTDTFVVYTSNIFAVMGLRAYYFLMAGVMGSLRFLKPALALVLVFIGGKMMSELLWHWQMEDKLSLAIVAGIVALAVVASLLSPKPPPPSPAAPTPLPSRADRPRAAPADGVPAPPDSAGDLRK